MQQAAQRLNDAFTHLEERIDALKHQLHHHPEVSLLEQENRQLHEELAAMRGENHRLRETVEDLGGQLDGAINQVEVMMQQAAGEIA